MLSPVWRLWRGVWHWRNWWVSQYHQSTAAQTGRAPLLRAQSSTHDDFRGLRIPYTISIDHKKRNGSKDLLKVRLYLWICSQIFILCYRRNLVKISQIIWIRPKWTTNVQWRESQWRRQEHAHLPSALSHHQTRATLVTSWRYNFPTVIGIWNIYSPKTVSISSGAKREKGIKDISSVSQPWLAVRLPDILWESNIWDETRSFAETNQFDQFF